MKDSAYPSKELEAETTANCSKTSLRKCASWDLEGWPPEQGAQATLFLSTL